MPDDELATSITEYVHIAKLDISGIRIERRRINHRGGVGEASWVPVKIEILYFERGAGWGLEGEISIEIPAHRSHEGRCCFSTGDPARPKWLRAWRHTARIELLPARV